MLAIDRGVISREFVVFSRTSKLTLQYDQSLSDQYRGFFSLGLKRPGRRSKTGKVTGENCVIRRSLIYALRHLLEHRRR